MRINHNIQALNAYRQLSQNQATVSKHLEKLSSGLRINRASDDAAGLAISEKMRSQIKGLSTAERNALDGISLIQTAEGALDSMHSILQRIRELAVQASNGTVTDEDRKYIQSEVNQLTAEIDRISSSTEFNKKILLDGSESDIYLQIGANEKQGISLGISKMSATELGLRLDEPGETGGTHASAASVAENDNTGTGEISFTDETTFSGTTGAWTVSFDGTDYSLDKGDGNGPQTLSLTEGKTTVDDLELDFSGISGAVPGDSWTVNVTARIGATISLSDPKSAQAAITKLDEAITKVSTERAKLGAIQNRLEHTTTNLSQTAENLTAAESRIRDADMAMEMANFTKNNIINQAATAMLAQANQLPQGVLQLLQG